jgi:MYXO-CTERM domain-containing protein
MSERRRDDTPPDPSGIEDAHDVLAAEEFAMPLRDSRMPQDPSGIQEAHDVLAAEEFAMPTGWTPGGEGDGPPRGGALPMLAVLALVALVLLRRRRRH